MNSCFYPDSCTEVLHGDPFSVLTDTQGLFWVVSNSFSTAFCGPYSFNEVRQTMITCNEFANSSNRKVCL